MQQNTAQLQKKSMGSQALSAIKMNALKETINTQSDIIKHLSDMVDTNLLESSTITFKCAKDIESQIIEITKKHTISCDERDLKRSTIKVSLSSKPPRVSRNKFSQSFDEPEQKREETKVSTILSSKAERDSLCKVSAMNPLSSVCIEDASPDNKIAKSTKTEIHQSGHRTFRYGGSLTSI
jgi:anionic cell wall polymer biosynthesis LytR-Cps2A-Psr (LCP) family protein